MTRNDDLDNWRAIAPGPYDVAVVDPADHASRLHLAEQPTLGIEMTVRRLAASCSLGNIDPQHGEMPSPVAAIEAAIAHPLPPDGSLLATIRPDLDAFGAMAVLALRRAGHDLEPALGRIAEIAAADGPPAVDYARGSSRPAVGTDEPGNEGTTRRALAAAVTDHTVSPADRVATVAAWLSTGSFPGVDRALDRLAGEAASDCEVEIALAGEGRIAVVCSNAPRALSRGYELAPVVVAECPDFMVEGRAAYRKMTVAQHEPGHVDLTAVRQALNSREPGWGGTDTILGSPQGRSTGLAVDEVVDLVARYLRDPPHPPTMSPQLGRRPAD